MVHGIVMRNTTIIVLKKRSVNRMKVALLIKI